MGDGVDPREMDVCRKVAAYLRKAVLPFLADSSLFRDKESDVVRDAKRNITGAFFIEFHMLAPCPVDIRRCRVDAKLIFAIKQRAANRIDGAKLKEICDLWIKAHTVAWQAGIPYLKSKEIG